MTIKYWFLPFLLVSCLNAGAAWAQKVTLVFDEELPQAAYAARKLGEALDERGYEVGDRRRGYDQLVSLSVHPERLGSEAFAIVPDGKVISVYGGDKRGLIYGALALAESLRTGTLLEDVTAVEEEPELAFRGIKYNLPWETYRPSSALDQHYETAQDLEYWEAFLDMMVANRFNAISLWNMHPYTFMIKPKNFPEASPWSKRELADWQELYRGIFRLAKERGLDTYLVHWSIFVSQEFAEAHDVAQQNFYPHYYVEGETSEIVRRYLRESVTQVLEEYPNLDGIGISHGEGMAGMTPLERQRWMDDVLIAGMLEADRPVKLIHRVPFSSGTSSEPGASKDVEVVTRDAMEQLEDRFDGPIWVEMKFNWSHAHSTPKLVKVHGGELGDTYFDPPPENYKITWQARNEDFFALRWGVPDFIREHIALNGQADYVGGYFVGSETYIPALDYFTAVDEPVDWRWAFERQWMFYKLWGRLLYDPETPDAVFQAEFNRRYGPRGDNLLNALSLASSTQLRLASLYDSRWDFTLYSEGFLALQGDYTRYISVDHLIDHPTMDPDYVSVADYVETLHRGGSFGVDRVTPPILADRLERDNREALRLVKDIDTAGNASLLYEVADIKTWANLGLHLAEKLRGAAALHRYRLSGDEEQKQAAVDHLQQALAYWDEVIDITRPLYRDMRLTHYNHNFFEANDDNLFHWALIRDQVARDIEIARESEVR
ncbi:glycoside hydrolase family 20 zincin-like fold domain-containing protein [Marinimicrobium sp. C2-29]|uniref:glycoside hydrolase family 20 zincin-like fold domain-containing protein n=1 Tax=Marinimicrobium sp. C2-29 TaxID=3139825 RepID=UPI0031390CAE